MYHITANVPLYTHYLYTTCIFSALTKLYHSLLTLKYQKHGPLQNSHGNSKTSVTPVHGIHYPSLTLRGTMHVLGEHISMQANTHTYKIQIHF